MNTESIIFDQAAQAVNDAMGLECKQTAWHLTRQKEAGYDGIARLQFRKIHVRQPYIARRFLNPSTLHLLRLLKQKNSDGLLLVTTHVSDKQADLLHKTGVHFIDMAGNVFLDAPGLYLWVTGRTSHSKVTSDRTRAFNPSGIQLLFALLTDPRLDNKTSGEALVSMPYRDISSATDISRSTVGWIMADLIRQRLVIEPGDGTRLLVERKRILERWVQGYMDRLRPSLVIERYRPTRGDWWKTASLDSDLWSGEVAAALLTGDLKPGTATIFGASPSHAFVLDHGLQKDPKGTVEFLKPFWREATGLVPKKKNCVHPLLVYADLMSIDDERTHETAQTVYDHYLRSIIETA